MRPIVFVHGYSDRGLTWATWRQILAARLNFTPDMLCTVTYVTLNNEVTIKDIAEGFDRALSTHKSVDLTGEFDAVVHSTGMQVVRSWVRADPRRVTRLKRLIAFAPVTFGSPLAKQGRSWLGAIFKGSKELGPDFLAAGDMVLDNLEPASTFTWDLAESDILAKPARYDNGPDTPYVFVFCGTGTYTGIRELVDKPGTDGTARRAGCGMNARKIDVDLTEQGIIVLKGRDRQDFDKPIMSADRIIADGWLQTRIPVHLIGAPFDEGSSAVNHVTILSDPPQQLQNLVVSAFQKTEDPATAEAGYSDWLREADADGRIAAMAEKYQQFIVHAVDERGDPITDYNVQIYGVDGAGTETKIEEFTAEVDVYDGDKSYRSFHVDVANLASGAPGNPTGLVLRILANSGTTYVAYLGHGCEQQIDVSGNADSTAWDAVLRFDAASLSRHEFFRPYTTTMIRLYMDRQVLPPDRTLPCTLVVWDKPLAEVDHSG